MKINFLLLTFLIILFTSCKKDEIEYKGEVVRGANDCTTPKGFPYIIKYLNANSVEDSLITASLPSEYKLPNTKILFKIMKNISAGEEMVCDGLILPLVQKSIYDVMQQ